MRKGIILITDHQANKYKFCFTTSNVSSDNGAIGDISYSKATFNSLVKKIILTKIDHTCIDRKV